ncbi:TraR/DksA C4-type zinc finger protein [Salsuginibacillus kocurii]|uniref:TraR/DksA C4-type zinc finger protein n=1 Tax=Salsuginibacillus kocurii TaxID=427078 RepID=UPI00037FF690|nr:TraR/DksA C4-type zinc finger protein [Salsuginibacillus kocurii]
MNEQQREKFKDELEDRRRHVEARLSHHQDGSLQETTSELSSYDNHPGDSATELYEREKDQAIAQHEGEELEDIDKALQAINNNTYGSCEICGKDIPQERLEVIPTTLRCVEHASHEPIRDRRPVEEDNLKADPIASSHEEEHVMFDAEDAWQSVSRYGSSETPSDIYQVDNIEDEETYPAVEQNIENHADVETFALADSDGKYDGVNEIHERYERELEVEEDEAALGEEDKYD